MDGVTRYKLRITFTEPLLGSAPLNAEVYTDFIASKLEASGNGDGARAQRIAEELDTLPEGDKGKTGFHRDQDGTPLLLDYHVKGLFKEAWQACREQPRRKSAALKAGKSKINKHVFVFPRHLRLHVTRPTEVGVVERPLRAETMQGPRVALAASEMVPEGTYFDCELHVLAPEIITEDLLNEWLGYGRYLGMGQWRSGSWGRYEYRLRKLE